MRGLVHWGRRLGGTYASARVLRLDCSRILLRIEHGNPRGDVEFCRHLDWNIARPRDGDVIAGLSARANQEGNSRFGLCGHQHEQIALDRLATVLGYTRG